MKKIDLLSSILREFENDIGTSELFLNVIQTLEKSLKDFQPKDEKDFETQFEALMYMLCHTQPRFGLFQHYIQKISQEFNEQKPLPEKRILFFQNILKQIETEAKKNHENILKYSDELETDKKSILIYEQSHIVRDVLKRIHTQGKSIRVIVAEQEYEKTHAIIEFLHTENIPFQVVPDYMLSHIERNVDMVFFGALTLQDTFEFVMPTGSHAVISEFNTMGIPVYVFMQTTKFSLWKSEKREIYQKKETRTHFEKPINYERLKFSHDRVHKSLFKNIITENGIMDSETIKDIFLTEQKKYKKKLKK